MNENPNAQTGSVRYICDDADTINTNEMSTFRLLLNNTRAVVSAGTMGGLACHFVSSLYIFISSATHSLSVIFMSNPYACMTARSFS